MEVLPTYPCENIPVNLVQNDLEEEWITEQIDSGSSYGPFLVHSSTIIDITDPKPELFFNQLFNDRMWTIISDATNDYARSKCFNMQGMLQNFKYKNIIKY